MADNYAHPDVLVTTAWVGDHINDPKVRLIECDVDTGAYEQGHVRGAVGWNWQTQLQDQVRRDLIGQKEFERLAQESGINADTTVVLYGDNNNWFAAWALWQFHYYGFQNVKLMDGGRKLWVAQGREIVKDVPKPAKGNFAAKAPDQSIRAFKEQVMEAVRGGKVNLVDVRSVDEFTGKVIAPPGMTETAQRGGHIPTARNIPWAQAVRDDGSFRPYAELKALYEGKGVTADKETIAYCRIGERSSHTWFVLKCLLGYKAVRNYDGSWTEYGNLVGAPIEKDVPSAAGPVQVCK